MQLHSTLFLQAVGVAALVGVSGLAQIPATQTGSGTETAHRPAFEVASVKPNKSGANSPQRVSFQPGERVRMVNVPLFVLIQIAYSDATRIIGGPKWMGGPGPHFDADRFDVNAKADAPSSNEQLRLMLQTLLAERFKLAVHVETRREDVYALRLARADGRLGPNIRPAAVDCRTLIAAATNPTSEKRPCGNGNSNVPPWHVRGVPITQLLIFKVDLGRPIVDKTGLTGSFDFDLNWTPRFALNPSFDHDRFPDIELNGPDLLTAVQEQLGLKFVPEKDDQSVLVIDHVEQPTPD